MNTFQKTTIIITYLTMVDAVSSNAPSSKTLLRGSSNNNRNLLFHDNDQVNGSSGNIVHDTLNWVGDLFHQPTNEPVASQEPTQASTQSPTQAPTGAPTQAPTQDSRDVSACTQVFRPVECIDNTNGLLETFGNSCYARIAGYSSNECVDVQSRQRNLWHDNNGSGNIIHDTLNWVDGILHKPAQTETPPPSATPVEAITLSPTNSPVTTHAPTQVTTLAPTDAPTQSSQCNETDEIISLMNRYLGQDCSYNGQNSYECGYYGLGMISTLYFDSNNLPAMFEYSSASNERIIYFDNDCTDASKVEAFITDYGFNAEMSVSF